MRVGVGEADLVFLSPDGRELVVVEVKARRGSAGERRPESQITAAKQRKLRSVAESVRKRTNAGAAKRPLGLRIDVVAVELRRWPRRSVVRHIERAVSWRASG